MTYWPSKYFKREEFACRCGCGLDTIDFATVAACEAIRKHFDRPVTVISGIRCPEHNRRVGGSKKSQHLRGRAADIQVSDTPPHLVAELARDMGLSVGEYTAFTHIDTREGQATWNG